MPVGTVVLKEGVILSASDALEVVFHGKGAHGSAPSSSIDPIVMGAHFVSDVQSVVSRQKDAGTFGVITVALSSRGPSATSSRRSPFAAQPAVLHA